MYSILHVHIQALTFIGTSSIQEGFYSCWIIYFCGHEFPMLTVQFKQNALKHDTDIYSLKHKLIDILTFDLADPLSLTKIRVSQKLVIP